MKLVFMYQRRIDPDQMHLKPIHAASSSAELAVHEPMALQTLKSMYLAERYPKPNGYGEPLAPGWTAPDKPRPIS